MGWGREPAATAAALALLLTAGAGSAVLWREPDPPGGAALASYLPLQPTLTVTRPVGGGALRWDSASYAVVPALEALTAWPDVVRVLLAQGGGMEATAATAFVELTLRSVDEAGTRPTTRGYLVRDGAGQHLVGIVQDDAVLVYDPPQLVVPANLTPGVTWESEGTANLDFDYVRSGQVTGGRHGCVRLEGRDALTDPSGEEVSAAAFTSVLCPGLGEVALRYGEEETLQVASRGPRRLLDAELPAPPVAAAPADVGVPSRWELVEVGRAHAGVTLAEGTFAPVAVGEVVLAAAVDHGVVALRADGAAAWGFSPGGAVHGRPAVGDGVVVLGSSDRRVYALDARGLFLWAAETRDNVAATPLLVGGVVVVGSEDGSVRALDRASGRVRWRVATAGPVVTAAAAAGERAFVGSDDGTVTALGLSDGAVAWRAVLGDPVAGDVAVADDAVVASAGGVLSALDTATGAQRWAADVGARGAAVAVDGGWAVVGDDGLLLLDARGDPRHPAVPGAWLGPPAVLGGLAVVADATGRLAAVDPATGEVHGSWQLQPQPDQSPELVLRLAPAASGGSVWLSDTRGRVVRLGPP